MGKKGYDVVRNFYSAHELGRLTTAALVWLLPDVGLMLVGIFFLLYGLSSPVIHAAHTWEDRLEALRGLTK